MPNLKCKTCGTEFPPIKESHYISRDLTKTCLSAALSSSDEPDMFDSYDCPCCGSQVIAQPRKHRYDPKSKEATDDINLAGIRNEIVINSDNLIRQMKNLNTNKPVTNLGCVKSRRPEGNPTLFFETLNVAQDTLDAITRFAEENNFISISDVNRLTGGTHILFSKWGWRDLSRAKIICCNNSYYISFPAAICDRPNETEEK